MSTPTVHSATDWRQPSQLHTISSGDICMQAAQTPNSKLKFVTSDKDSSMSEQTNGVTHRRHSTSIRMVEYF